MLDHAEGWVMAAIPPSRLDIDAGSRSRCDDRSALPHPNRRRLADVLTAIRLGMPVNRIGVAADRNGTLPQECG
jgi:hypothetical protein